jgi:AcrR family transcriptional regulator
MVDNPRKPRKPTRKPYVAYGSRREEIVVAAATVFAEEGMVRTRMADVASRIGIDQANLRYHFPSRESLIAELTQRVISRYVEFSVTAMEKGRRDPLSMLERYVRSYFEWIHSAPSDFEFFMYFLYLASTSAEFTRVNEGTRTIGRERIGALIYAAIAEEQIPKPRTATVSELSRMIQSTIIGQAVSFFTEGGAREAGQAKAAGRIAWAMTRAILDGGA